MTATARLSQKEFIAQLEEAYDRAGDAFWAARCRVHLYPPIRPKDGDQRPLATDRDVEELRVLQCAVIGAAIRYLEARGLSNRLTEERKRIRTMDTETYREYVL